MKTPYDPKLREAANEFTELCLKYDIAGHVLFTSKTHSEFAHHISPSWSVIHYESMNRLRFRSKLAEFSSKEEQHECTEATVHILTSVTEWSRQLNGQTRSLLEQLGKHMKIGWRVWGTPDSIPGDGK